MIERHHLMLPLAESAASAASYADLFSSSTDLFCREVSSDMLTAESPSTGSSTVWMEADAEQTIVELIEGERFFVPGRDYRSRFLSRSLEASAREDSIAWMLKVQEFYGFQPLTTYLSVNYMDRFLSATRFLQIQGWPIQLVSVACLSLAAKMEEPIVPKLPDFQIIGADFIFEPRTISRMELLVLGVLGWRLRSVTPFNFIEFFAWKLDPTGRFVAFIISRASKIILANITDASLVGHRPSSIAAAAILCVSSEVPELSQLTPDLAVSWSDGLCKEKIINCYQVMHDLVVTNSPKSPAKVCPPLRPANKTRIPSSDSSSSSSLSNKRRKLNNCSWIDDKKGTSD